MSKQAQIPSCLASEDVINNAPLSYAGSAQRLVDMGTSRLAAFDGLRALAIVAVIGFHYQQGRVPGGAIGVQVFFVLSGWLITGILARELDQTGRVRVCAFYARRALRLYPALVMVVALVVLAAPIAGLTHNLAFGVTGSLLYLNDLFMAMGRASGWLDPTWSLAVEWQFYLVWPFVILVLLRRDRRQAGWILVGASLAMFAVEGVAGSFHPGWTGYTPVGSVAALMLGSAVALLRLQAPRIAGAAAAALIVALCFQSISFFHGPTQVGAIAAAVVVAWLDREPNASGFASRPAVWLGQRSYGVYLFHQAMLIVVLTALGISAPNILVLAIGVPASLALAALSYRYVEQPFLRRKARFEPRSQRAAVPVREPEANDSRIVVSNNVLWASFGQGGAGGARRRRALRLLRRLARFRTQSSTDLASSSRVIQDGYLEKAGGGPELYTEIDC